MDFRITINEKNLTNLFPVVFENDLVTVETNKMVNLWTNDEGATFILIGKLI